MKFLAVTFIAGSLWAQGVPVNLDTHPGMDLAGVNGVTAHMGMAKPMAAPASSGIQPVFTRSGDNLRHGVYAHETRLTPDVVRAGLKLVGSLKMSGDARGMEAQPLFAPGINAKGSVRDLVLCGTMANRVYAFDAKTYKQVWMTALGTPIKGSSQIDGWGINDNWGILSTPVIENGFLYAVAWISPDKTPGNAAHWLFEIGLTDGKVSRKLQLPASGSVQRKQRASLSIANGTLFIPWGTVQEVAAGAHGFVTAVSLAQWKIADEWSATATGSGSGIWMAGAAPSITTFTRDGKLITVLWIMTGNGDFNPAKGNYGESFVRLEFDGVKFTVPDWWTVFRDVDRVAGYTDPGGWQDMDLGSGGAIAIPELDLACGAGKDSIFICVRMSNMGKTQPGDLVSPAANYAKLAFPPIFIGFNGLGLNAAPNDIRDLNQLFYGKTHHQHGSPLFWNGKLYNWSENGNLRAWALSRDGIKFLARSTESASYYAPAIPGGMPGSGLAISSNGTSNGVVWSNVPDGDANKTVTTGRIFAYDASTFPIRLPDGDFQMQRLWMSDIPPAGHHSFQKFGIPVVNDGRVWMATYDDQVLVFGVQ